MKNQAPCKLCKQVRQLRSSHVIPKFVFRWLKETGGTDYLRFGGNPNRRVQDGLVHPLLCDSCEQRLGEVERVFKEKFFAPVVAGAYPRGNYNDWLLRFSASVVWRVGQSQVFRGTHQSISDEMRGLAENALSTWQRFLVGEIPHPGIHEVHLFPIGGFGDLSDPRYDSRIPSNWNRYTLRQVETDFIFSESGRFQAYYAKLGPIALFGIVQNSGQKWQGTRIAANSGPFTVPKMILPPFLLEFFIDRAINSDRIFGALSPKQRNITAREVEKNIERLASSDQFKAMEKDALRFGIASIVDKQDVEKK